MLIGMSGLTFVVAVFIPNGRVCLVVGSVLYV